MGEPTTTSTFAHPLDESEQDNNVDPTPNNDVQEEDPELTDNAGESSPNGTPSSAYAYSQLMAAGGFDSGEEDRGNYENKIQVDAPTVNDEGYLIDPNGKKLFTTIEESVKDGSFVLDANGRMPGVYLDDIEKLQRQSYEKAVLAANDAAAAGTNSPIERQVNVNNANIPPVTVVSKQEHPNTGEAKSDDSEVPVLKENPLPAE